MSYGMPPRPPAQQQLSLSQQSEAGSGSSLQYDNSNFPTLLSGQPQTRYPMMSQHQAMSGAGGAGRAGEEEFTNLNDDDFPALPGSSQPSSSHKMPLRSEATGEGDPGPHSSHDHFSNGARSYPASGGGLHPPSPGLYSNNNTPNRPKVSAALSPKLQPTGEAAPTSSPLRPEAKYGLLGLLDVIRLTDRVSLRPSPSLTSPQDLNILALGSDLTTYGLNLNSSECLYASFASPFSDHSLSSEPQFTTPNCYLMHPPSLKPEHMSKFLVETLFYMFFAMPRDAFQVSSAQELYRREWRWHAELRLWLKPRSPQEQMQSHPGVQYVYFDPSAWEARLFTNATRTPLATGFLSGPCSARSLSL
jgi:hypothetical protein